MRTIADVGEFGLIAEVTAGLESPPEVYVGPGDDGAVLAVASPLVVSTDLLVEHVHFRRDWGSAFDTGRKAVAVSVSDLEAMGATGRNVIVGFTAPKTLEADWAVDCVRGIRAECEVAGMSLVGGDMTSGSEIVLAMTVLGELDGVAPVLRSGARAGDEVAVLGRLGWAAAGLAVLSRGFRSPRAVVHAYQCPAPFYGAGKVAAEAGATAMIDVSDGLLADLGHIAQASGVVIDVTLEAFDVPDPLQAVAQATGKDPLQFILTGGEDHALAATFPPGTELEGWTVIGTVLAPGDEGPGVTVDGEVWDGPTGWTHF